MFGLPAWALIAAHMPGCRATAAGADPGGIGSHYRSVPG